MKKISTSALTKKLNIESKKFIDLLEENWYIAIKNKSLFSSEKIKVLTEKWIQNGWELKTGTKFGDYIVWPEDFNPFEIEVVNQDDYVSVSRLAEDFNTSARKMNLIFSELGWIEPNLKGWKLTKFGAQIWGKEFVIQKSWATYTKWPENITKNNSLLHSLWIKTQNKTEHKPDNTQDSQNFRDTFPAQYRTKDGHMVRSRWETLIDDYLYGYNISHAYERKLPIEEDVYSDFYIPAQKWSKAVYIEYWWIEDQEKYQDRKKIKQDIYKKYHLNLIELENKHIDNLDDYLPRMLLEFGISVD